MIKKSTECPVMKQYSSIWPTYLYFVCFFHLQKSKPCKKSPLAVFPLQLPKMYDLVLKTF